MAWFLEKCTTDCKSFTAGVKCLLSLKSHQNVTRGKRFGFGSRGNRHASGKQQRQKHLQLTFHANTSLVSPCDILS